MQVYNLATMSRPDAPRPGQTPDGVEVSSVRERTMTTLASGALLGVINSFSSESVKSDELAERAQALVRIIISATEISIADRIRLRAEEMRGSGDGPSIDAATLFDELADSIAPISTERQIQQE